MKHVLKKLLFSLLVCAVLAGCGKQNSMESPVSKAFDGIPVLCVEYGGGNESAIRCFVWNTREASLAEDQSAAVENCFLEGKNHTLHWTGAFLLADMPQERKDGEPWPVFSYPGKASRMYGKCWYNAAADELVMQSTTGVQERVAVPKTLPDEWAQEPVVREPFFASVDGTEVVTAYSAYRQAEEDQAASLELAIGRYNWDSPENVAWTLVHIPDEPGRYDPSQLLLGPAAIDAGGTLYLACCENLVAVDTRTGTLSVAGDFSTVHSLCPQGTHTNESGYRGPRIEGYYRGLVIVSTVYYTGADGAPHVYYIALDGGSVAAVWEVQEGMWRVYDGELNCLQTYQTDASYTLLFPQDY